MLGESDTNPQGELHSKGTPTEGKPKEQPEKDKKSGGLDILAAVVWGAGGILAVLIGLYGESLMEAIGIKWLLSHRGCLALFLSVLVVFTAYWTWESKRKYWKDVRRLLPAAPLFLLIWICILGHANWGVFAGVIASMIIIAIPLIEVTAQGKGNNQKLEEDLLGLNLLYEGMEGIVRRRVETEARKGKGLTIGVSGAWGSGKSFFIRQLAYRLKHKNNENNMGLHSGGQRSDWKGGFSIVMVDVWKSATVESLVRELGKAISSAIRDSHGDIDIYSLRTTLRLLLSCVGISTNAISDEVVTLLTTATELSEQNIIKISSRIKNSQKKCILVLDNIDRCGKEKMFAIFSMLERLRKISGLITICGISIGDLMEARGAECAKLSSFIHKSFDLIVPIANLTADGLVAYKEELIKRNGSHNHRFAKWFSKQDLPFPTPRELENVAQEVSMLDECYMNYLEDEEDDKTAELDGELSKVETSFYVAVLRICFAEMMPGIERVIELYESANNKGEKENRVIDEITQQIKSNFPRQYSDKALLRSVLNKLDKASDSNLIFAIRQNYLRITQLPSEECEKMISGYICARRQCSPYAYINKYLRPGSYNKKDMPKFYLRVLGYAIKHIAVGDNQIYVRDAFEEDIFPEKLKILDYINDTRLIAKLLDSYYLLADERLELAESLCGQITSAVLQRMSFSMVARILSAFLSQINEGYSELDIYKCEFTRVLTNVYINRKYLEDDEFPSGIIHLRKLILKGYAAHACKSIIAGRRDEYMELIIGRSNPSRDFVPCLNESLDDILKEGTKISTYLPPKDMLCARILQSVTAPLPSVAGKIVPLAASSFAVIWDSLRKKYMTDFVPNPQQTQYIDQIQIALREQKRYLEKSEQAKEWSDNFRSDRMNAIEVLGNGLEEILKHN